MMILICLSNGDLLTVRCQRNASSQVRTSGKRKALLSVSTGRTRDEADGFNLALHNEVLDAILSHAMRGKGGFAFC